MYLHIFLWVLDGECELPCKTILQEEHFCMGLHRSYLVREQLFADWSKVNRQIRNMYRREDTDKVHILTYHFTQQKANHLVVKLTIQLT